VKPFGNEETSVASERRPLSVDEQRILRLLRGLYGERNTEEKVVFLETGEALIFVEDESGRVPIMVHLTNVGSFAVSDGLSDEETITQWLLGGSKR
jgi:hypothetical protein